MDTWNLREKAKFCTKIANNLFWVPANSLEIKDGSNSSNSLYNILYNFQMSKLVESSENRILKLDQENKIIWEFFDSPEEVVSKYKKGNCAVFCLWLNYFLSKIYEKTGYILIIRNTGTWHVLNYVKLGDWYYIIDPNNLLEKFKDSIPVENGDFMTYAHCNMITGGVLKTTSLNDFVSYYEKYVAIGGLKYIFFKIDEYQLPYFCIEHLPNRFNIHLNSQSKIEILNNYAEEIYQVFYSVIDNTKLIPIKEREDINIWQLLMKTKNTSLSENY